MVLDLARRLVVASLFLGVSDHFRPELNFVEAETPASAGFTGNSTGAPLSLTKNTMNFDRFVLLHSGQRYEYRWALRKKSGLA